MRAQLRVNSSYYVCLCHTVCYFTVCSWPMITIWTLIEIIFKRLRSSAVKPIVLGRNSNSPEQIPSYPVRAPAVNSYEHLNKFVCENSLWLNCSETACYCVCWLVGFSNAWFSHSFTETRSRTEAQSLRLLFFSSRLPFTSSLAHPVLIFLCVQKKLKSS